MLNALKNVLRRLLNLVVNSFALFLGETPAQETELERLLADLQAQMAALQEQLAGVLVQKAQLEQKRRAALTQASEHERQAEAALSRGDEDAAREALRCRLPHTRRAEALGDELLEQGRAAAALQKALDLLQATLAEARGQQDVLAAQERRLQAEELARQALHPRGAASDLRATLDQDSDALARRQDRLRAAQEVEQASLAPQQAELEVESAVNVELQALRRRLQVQNTDRRN
jgi:phage shock protein A